MKEITLSEIYDNADNDTKKEIMKVIKELAEKQAEKVAQGESKQKPTGIINS